MYRPIVAFLVVASLFVVFAALPVKAQDGLPMCFAKDQVIGDVVGEAEKADLPISHKKLSPEESDNLTELLITKSDLEPARSYVLFWTDSVKGDQSVVVITRFDVHNCYMKGPIQTNRSLVSHLIGGPEA